MHILSDTRRRAASAGRPLRFLVLSASMGAGHDAVAAALGARLAAGGHLVTQADVLDLRPAGTGPALRSGYHELAWRSRLAAHDGRPVLLSAGAWGAATRLAQTAATALIDNAAGQTCLEALAAGLPVVGYRPLPGYGREGVARMAKLELSELATDPDGLIRALGNAAAPGTARDDRVVAGRALAGLGGGSQGHVPALAGLASFAGARQ